MDTCNSQMKPAFLQDRIKYTQHSYNFPAQQ